MYRDDYFLEIGKDLFKHFGIKVSILGAGGYSYMESEVSDLTDFRDLDFMIIVNSKDNLEQLLQNGQKIIVDSFKIKELEYKFNNSEIESFLSGKYNFIRIAGTNIKRQKISIKITCKKTLLHAYRNIKSNDFLILSCRDKRFFIRKSVFGNSIFVGNVNTLCFNDHLSVWGDKDFYIYKNQCIPGLITDMLITGKNIHDDTLVDLTQLKALASQKLVELTMVYRDNYPHDWSDIFVRGERFPKIYKDSLNNYLKSKEENNNTPKNIINKDNNTNNYFLNFVKNSTTNKYCRHSFKKLFRKKQIKKLTNLPKHAIVFNSDFGKLVLEDNSEYFFKRPKNLLCFNQELNGLKNLSKFYCKVQDPIYWDKESNIISYKWSNYQPLSKRFIENSISDNETVMEIELKRARDIINAYTSSTNNNKGSSMIHNLYFDRLTGGRLDNFYGNTIVRIGTKNILLSEVFKLTPIVNGKKFKPINKTIDEAVKFLNPNYLEKLIKVCGLGDGHFGNLMVNDTLSDYFYIDYEFSGNHSPYIDMAKPIYLDCFWRVWLGDYCNYENINIEAKIIGTQIYINHNFNLSELEKMMLITKTEIINEFNKSLGVNIEKKWTNILNSALVCCALLTRNISEFDNKLFLLNLTCSILVGSFSDIYNEL